MEKKETGRASSFVFDEKGQSEVSEQIMNSYNSGFIDQDTARASRPDYAGPAEGNLEE